MASTCKRKTYPPSGWLLTARRTPLFSLAHGTRAYACSKFRALPNSRLTFLSSSLRRTGRGLKIEETTTVVPRCARQHYAGWGVEVYHDHTCLATLELEFISLPFLSISSMVPIGASLAVAVVRVTPSLRAHKEDNASPRKPKVKTVERSSKAASLEV